LATTSRAQREWSRSNRNGRREGEKSWESFRRLDCVTTKIPAQAELGRGTLESNVESLDWASPPPPHERRGNRPDGIAMDGAKTGKAGHLSDGASAWRRKSPPKRSLDGAPSRVIIAVAGWSLKHCPAQGRPKSREERLSESAPRSSWHCQDSADDRDSDPGLA
jgi:hypothetical protein